MNTLDSADLSAAVPPTRPPAWIAPLLGAMTDPGFFEETFGLAPWVHHNGAGSESTDSGCGFTDPEQVVIQIGSPVNIISPRDGRKPIEKTVHTLDEALAAYRSGWGMAIADVDTRLPDVHTARCFLADMLEIPWSWIRTGLFLAPPGGGLAYHFDARHIFSIQWLGTKRWAFEPNTQAPYPLENHVRPHALPVELARYVTEPLPDGPSSAATHVVMSPGQILYLPLGTWHETEALTPSVSVSFGVDIPRVLDEWLQRLRDHLLVFPLFRNSRMLPKSRALRPEAVHATQLEEINLLLGLVSSWKKAPLDP